MIEKQFHIFKSALASPVFGFITIVGIGVLIGIALINTGVLPLGATLAAFGGLGLGLVIEVLTGTSAAKRKGTDNELRSSRKYYEPSSQGLAAEYITVVAAIARNRALPFNEDSTVDKPMDEFLENASRLARQIIETDELSEQEIHLVLDTQRLLASYVLSPFAQEDRDILPDLMNHLGSLSLVGTMGEHIQISSIAVLEELDKISTTALETR